jgi:hypothetical protein
LQECIDFPIFEIIVQTKKVIDLVHGPVDRVHGTMVHGCTSYIKLRPSKSGSTVEILKTEGLSQDLIVTVRVGFDGARLSGQKQRRHALCSRRRHGRPPELRSREAHSMVARVQTLKRGGGHYDPYPEAKTW